jgi:hypothetical protein
MAGDWIKMRTGLSTSPKVVRMSSALRADRFRVIGGLHAVWCLFDEHSEDGVLDGYTPETVDEIVGFPGIAAAMESVGWLINQGHSVCVPRFEDHNGKSAKRRVLETERKRDVRKVSASHADKKRTREEKRREDISSENVEHQQGDAGASARAGFENPGTANAVTVAAQAMRSAGLSGVSDGNPALIAAVAAGLTAAELGAAAADAVAKGKGFPWAIAAAEGRRRDAAGVVRALPVQAAATDPDSRASIEAAGEALGLGRWDQLREHWPAYRARVKQARGDAPVGAAANVLQMVMAGARVAVAGGA